MDKPLAEIFRPKRLEDIIGQGHIAGEGKIFDRILKSGNLPSMIFYGPPGIGKTTAANILSRQLDCPIYKFNATYTKTEEIKSVMAKYSKENQTFNISRAQLGLSDILKNSGKEKKRPVIYVDEIQNFNKKQQQIFLEYIENGSITLIGATTENPNHYIYPALLSRCTILEFYKVPREEIAENLKKTIGRLNSETGKKISISDEAADAIAVYADMDVRRSINLLELTLNLYLEEEFEITEEVLKSMGISRQFAYDMKGDDFYDILSAFQKSIRGSDPDAAIFYLARAIKAGDIKPICRRLMVIASEDIGLAYPNAAMIVKSCVDSALALGLPEARIPLAQAVLLLATAPKSNSSIVAIDSALLAIDEKGVGNIPKHLRDSHYKGAEELGRGADYKYAHSYENSYVQQQYLPNEHMESKFYNPGKNKFEQQIEEYWEKIKKNR